MKSILPVTRNALLVFVLAAVSAYSTTVTANISQAQYTVGDFVPVEISIQNVTDLYAFQLDLTFNPAVLSAQSISEGGYFLSNGVSFSAGTINNNTGMISLVADSLSGPGPGFTGSTMLATVDFSALRPGSSGVFPIDVILLDSNLSDIAANTSAAAVTVTATPEPTSMWLLAGGLCVGAIALTRSGSLKWANTRFCRRS